MIQIGSLQLKSLNKQSIGSYYQNSDLFLFDSFFNSALFGINLIRLYLALI